MSNVTNLIVCCDFGDNGAKSINRYPHIGGDGKCLFELVSVHNADLDALNMKWYGGGKVITTEMLIGAVNHFDIHDFMAYLRIIEFDNDAGVQVIYCNEDTDGLYEIINLTDT